MRDTDRTPPEDPPLPAGTESLEQALLAPFEQGEVKFKPAVVSGNRALALPYVDARVIQDRLDEVLGVAGWQDEYECLPDGSVVCRLRLRLGSEWITKMDVGGPSEQPDEGDRIKAACSDALKRAAVKFGVGRYLYNLPDVWADYDPQKKRFTGTLAVPEARPRPPFTPPRRRPSIDEIDAGWAGVGVIRRGDLLAAVEDGRTTASQFISIATGTHLRKLMLSRGGIAWEEVRLGCGLPETSSPEKVTREQFGRALAWLGQRPGGHDAP